jgi:ribosomal protein L29
MKIKELREKSVDELKSMELELLTKLYNKKNEARAAKKMEKSHEIKSMKKTRSQILTLLAEIEATN